MREGLVGWNGCIDWIGQHVLYVKLHDHRSVAIAQIPSLKGEPATKVGGSRGSTQVMSTLLECSRAVAKTEQAWSFDRGTLSQRRIRCLDKRAQSHGEVATYQPAASSFALLEWSWVLILVSLFSGRNGVAIEELSIQRVESKMLRLGT